MALQNPALARLAELFGISTEFWDWKGRQTLISDETVVRILKAMGIDASTDEAANAAVVEQEEKPWRRRLPPCVVIESGKVGYVNVQVPAGYKAELAIQLEDGSTRYADQIENWSAEREIDGQLTGEATFQFPDDLPLGYHRLVLTSDDRPAEGTLIVSPSYLGLPKKLNNRRIWGYAVQLYSVHSHGSWGVGDLDDLKDLAVWSATQQQADYILINPLHAAEPVAPMEPSPYLPVSRRFVNPMYIRPETIPEYADVLGAKRLRIRSLHTQLAAKLEKSDRIQRDLSWSAKKKALRIIYEVGLNPGRQMAFDAYRRSEGRELRDFAAWSVLCEHLGSDWRDWPEIYQRPSSPEVGEFVADHRDEVEFVEWQQWIAQDQLSRAQQVAHDAGMGVGIVTDLAVGVNPAGADPWMMSDVYARGVSVGAPPDAYNQLGQDWTQPPWRPDRLADLAYVPFRMMVRNALAHAGGIRIDHILGMFRLWWVPEGGTPDQGCYVRYDHNAMIGIIALEALRADAFVIGEDLGTVEPWVREYLARRGLLGTSVLWFEGDENGPITPDRWRESVMASVTTHDLAPTAGFLAMDHVRLRHSLGLLTEPLEDELAAAANEQRFWINYLRETGALSNEIDGVEVDDVEAKVLGLHKALTWSPSRVLNVALVDAVGERRIQNQPGTVDEYPNWRIPLCGSDGQPLTIEQIVSMSRPMRLAAVINGYTHVPPPWHA
jgi:4-alpha-glucanotransferase